jgi:hypothetical protein
MRSAGNLLADAFSGASQKRADEHASAKRR